METIFFYLACIWGLTHILVASKLFAETRDWLLVVFPGLGEMLNCYQCTSFWVSIFLYPWFALPDIGIYNLLGPLMWAFIGSGITSFLSIIFSLIIKLTKSKADI